MKFLILRNCWSGFLLHYISNCFLLFVYSVCFMFFGFINYLFICLFALKNVSDKYMVLE